jgi:radical SAM superfamily enzyme YgiQ (UPF0313 family)
MRVLLAQPPLSPAREVVPPLGLCTLASWLKQQGHDLRIVDLDLEIKWRAGGPSEHFDEPFVEALEDFRPDAVAVTSMYSNSLQAEHLVRVAKRYDSGLATVAGGSHFGAQGVSSLRRIAELDYVVEGEGELAFASLLSALECGDPVSQVPRLCQRIDGQPLANPPGPLVALADLPPMWMTLGDCVDLGLYARTIPARAGRRVAYVEAGRGCPYACAFCATAPFWQRRYRVKPVARIVDEIRFLHEEFGYDSFILVHDLLTANTGFVSDFCDAMLDSRLPVEWMANSRTDIRLHGLLPKMKAAGCWKVFLGVESASVRMQELIVKHLEPDDVYGHIADLRNHGISATCSFVIGLPDETASELSSTLGMGARLKILGVETVQFHRLRLFPPSPLSRSGLPVEFDLDTLRIEYPFLLIPPHDIAEIAGDPEFFEGYFAPQSAAGEAAQLAQVEMFFHHAIALVPLSVATLASFMASHLVDSFYETIAECGPISREGLDWESGDLFGNWLTLRPVLERWVERQRDLDGWRAEIVRGLLDYESIRLRFVCGDPSLPEGALTSGDCWVAIEATIDIARVLERLGSGRELTPELLASVLVIFVRRANGSFVAYTLDVASRPVLLRRDHLLISAIEDQPE